MALGFEQKFQTWAQQTWATQLSNANIPGAVADVDLIRLSETLQYLRLKSDYGSFSSKPVTGNVAQGWKDLNRYSPYFQDSYNAVVTTLGESWTPADYLVHFAACCKAGPQFIPPYDLGRAMRNLPSYIREDSLTQACLNRGIAVDVPTRTENFLDHADLYLNIGGTRFTVWSFIDTPKARRSVVHKLFRRGHDLEGLHVLAPIDLERDTVDIEDWKIVDSSYADRMANGLHLIKPLSLERTLTLARLGLASNSGFTVLDGEVVNTIRKQSQA